MDYICGIDGGGTSTRTAISYRGRIISIGESGSSNIYAVGEEQAIKNIASALKSALAPLNLNSDIVVSTHIGAAGLGKEENIRFFKERLKKLLPSSIISCSNDGELLLSSSGLALIAGTGSIAIGKNEEGLVIRSGGFGWRLGDEGSAFHIAKEAIRRTLRSKEKVDLDTALDKDISAFFPVKTLNEIIYYVNSDERKKDDIASFAPVVIKRAKDNDELAIDILKREIDELALLIKSLIKRLPPPYNKSITLSGGVFIHNAFIREALIKKVNKDYPEFSFIAADERTALEGAIAFALKNLNS